MALTHSTMLLLGTPLPSFELPDVTSGIMFTSSQFSEKQGILVMFICRHCPYVVHVQEELSRLGRDYYDKGLGMVAISSNDVDHYPDDRPQRLKAMAQELGFRFPYCYDESQEVAKVFTASGLRGAAVTFSWGTTAARQSQSRSPGLCMSDAWPWSVPGLWQALASPAWWAGRPHKCGHAATRQDATPNVTRRDATRSQPEDSRHTS